MNNAYSELIDIIKDISDKATSANVRIGEVTHIENDGFTISDIKIRLGEIPLDKDDLYLPERILSSSLNIGDKVSVLSTKNKQTYVVIDKVVRI